MAFAILHEITAILPFGGIFFGARALGLGDKVVEMVQEVPNPSPETGEDGFQIDTEGFKEEAGWVVTKMREYMDEGQTWTTRVGRRYGIWGHQKGENPLVEDGQHTEAIKHRIAGDVANAVLAYGVSVSPNQIFYYSTQI